MQVESWLAHAEAAPSLAPEFHTVVPGVAYVRLSWSTAVCCQGVVQTVSLSAVQDVKPELQPISQLWRFTLNPQSAHMEGHPLSQRAMEYPSVNPDLSGELPVSSLAAVWNMCQLFMIKGTLTAGHEQMGTPDHALSWALSVACLNVACNSRFAC